MAKLFQKFMVIVPLLKSTDASVFDFFFSFRQILKRPLQKAGSFLILSFLFFQSPYGLQAQQSTTPGTQQEVWPEVDGYYKINKTLRLMGAVTATKAETDYSDGALAFNVDYFTLRSLRTIAQGSDLDSTRGYYQWFRLGLKYNRPDPSSKDPEAEYTIRSESNTRFYPGWETILTVRNRFDFQDKSGFWTVIYRPRITWERDFRTTYLYFTGYVYAEYYAFFDDAPTNRFSACLGAQLKVSRLIVFESYYLYQFQNPPKVGAVNAIGLRLRFYMPVKK
jgi:hypothetical protein